PLADDGEFLRRVMLDLVGYPPSLEQVKAFMADTNVDKRSEKIDQLLDSEDWADRTARLFCEGWFEDYHKVPIIVSPKMEGGAEGGRGGRGATRKGRRTGDEAQPSEEAS